MTECEVALDQSIDGFLGATEFFPDEYPQIAAIIGDPCPSA